MKNFVKQGHVMTFTAPTGGAVSGVPLLIAAMLIIPAYNAAEGEECEGATVGVFELPKKAADTPAQFVPAYWDNTAKNVTTTASTNKKIGSFAFAYEAGTEVAQVRLDGVSVA